MRDKQFGSLGSFKGENNPRVIVTETTWGNMAYSIVLETLTKK